MEYEEFKKYLMESVREEFPLPYQIKLHNVRKNNGLLLESLVILQDDCNLSPQFYVQKYYARYEQGESIDDLVQEICDAYRETVADAEQKTPDLSFAHCRERIIYRLVSMEKNEEQFASMPYIPFLNLAITFHCLMVQEKEGIGSIRINNTLLQSWELDHKQLFALAQENTMRLFPAKHCKLEQLMMDMIGECGVSDEQAEKVLAETQSDSSPVTYVVTNESGINGAAVILYPKFLQQIATVMGGSYYLLPSSIHEMLIVEGSTTMTVQQLRRMVHDVNERCVQVDEVLSDDVYYYNDQNGAVEICK